jgi:pimeloyl-ACP methyl ester carboxylesterase
VTAVQCSWQEASLDLDGLTVRYRARGGGQPVVFVHGVYMGGTVWNAVAERLEGVRCIVPTWPLGAHRDPAPSADLSARAIARRIPAFLEALDLRDAVLVGNDTGGGLCLAALGSGSPAVDRIGGLVLTNCDSYEHFPPKGFDTIAKVARRAPLIVKALLRLLSSRPGQRMFLKSVSTEPPKGEAGRELFEAFPTSKGARRDALRTTASLEPSVTMDAVGALRAFSKPVLLAWGDADRLFPLEHARRLEADFPNARLEIIEGSSTYVMLDRPAELARLVQAFRTTASDSGDGGNQ